jgi:hypothetical protein
VETRRGGKSGDVRERRGRISERKRKRKGGRRESGEEEEWRRGGEERVEMLERGEGG